MAHAHGIETDALKRFLAGAFGRSGTFAIEPISGGQSNPTFYLTYGDRRMVLRKKPAGPILKGAHAVEREFRVLSALQETDVPVPRPLLLREADDVLDTPFYLMERLDGRIFHDAALSGAAPGERGALYRGMAEAMARLHAVDPEAVGLGDFGRPGNYFERQIARWSSQWIAADVGPIPALDRLIAWLPENLPPDDGRVAIAHGDFRLGNMMFHSSEPHVVAILDWELATLGHPLADLGFCVMPWHTAPDEYGGILGLNRTALALPSEDDFLAWYSAAALPTGPLGVFHRVFALFRFAVIFVGIAERARKGNAAGANAENLEPLARRFAGRACALAGI